MFGSRGNKGRMEEKMQVVYDIAVEALKELKAGKPNVEELRKRLEYIKKVSYELVMTGEDIRNLIGQRIDNLDRELVKLI